MRLEPGAQFDRFTVEALLGEGGMGQVYRAYDARLARRVALKILRARTGEERGEGADRVSLILREARAAAALDHPNAVSIFEMGEHDGVPFMAMELISGVPLRALVGHADVPMDQRVIWLLDVARVLEAAHRAGIVHLDIKPENVMVRSDGVVKVLDFGIARRTDFVPDPGDATSWQNARTTALTQGSALVGTLPYMAPEQVYRRPVDGRTDQFAWGVLAYELCTGSLPWPTNGTAFDLLSAILTKTPPPLAGVVPEVSPAVSAVVMRALAKAPEDRFPGMGEIVGALGTALGGAVTTRGARSLPMSVAPALMLGGAAPEPTDENARRALAHMLTESSHVSDDLVARVSALALSAPLTGSHITPGALSIELPGSQKEALAALSTAPIASDPPKPSIAARSTQRSGEPSSEGARPLHLPALGPPASAAPPSRPARSRDGARGPATEDLPHESEGSPLTPSLPSSQGRSLSDPPEEPGAATRKSPGADSAREPSPPSERVRVETREGGSYPGLVPEARRSSAPPSEAARTAVTPSGEARQRRKLPVELVWTALAVAVALGLLLWKGAPGNTPVVSGPAAVSAVPSAAQAASTPITALPVPTDCNAAALAEYRTGIQGLHDGNWEQAYRSFGRAVAADDHCAEAELRLVMTSQGRVTTSEVRKVYVRAAMLRTQLTERDQGILDALDPIVRSDPANYRAYREKLADLARRYPGDAEIAFLEANQADDQQLALDSAQRALRIDPSYSDAWQTKGRALARMGRTPEALDVLEQCLTAAPNSVDCVRERITLLRRTGHCADMARDARTWNARDPGTASGYLMLAEALASEGGPREAVSEALHQRWSKLDPGERARREIFEGALLDALGGDFEAAAERARALARLVEADANYEPHVRPAFVELGLLAETGQNDQAAHVAAEFLKRKAAWSSSLTPDSLDVAVYSFEPRLLAAARHSGGAGASPMTTGAFTAARDAWAAATEDAGTLHKEVLWAFGFAMPAETPAEAQAVLASMPPRLLASEGYLHAPAELSGAFVGRALLLAGRVDEAVAFLRVATRSCFALDDPFVHTRAFLWLGQALEQQKDKDGACAAYHRVEDRWGKARPRSVTAEEAQRRAAALKCPR